MNIFIRGDRYFCLRDEVEIYLGKFSSIMNIFSKEEINDLFYTLIYFNIISKQIFHIKKIVNMGPEFRYITDYLTINELINSIDFKHLEQNHIFRNHFQIIYQKFKQELIDEGWI